ncbi:MAG: aminotransferase class V-fold PLP-dependent enzyme [Candidatus Kariarchaeaceae archaeon]
MNTEEFDIQKARLDTPACKEIIHFNNAGASLMPEPVLNTVKDHLQLEARIGGYEAADEEKERINSVYDSLAHLINAQREEIAIIENATRAWDMAFYSIPFKPGDRILTVQAEYVSNYLAFLQVSKRFGVKIDVVPNDEHGQVSVDALENMIDERVKLINITHVPTNGGLINPVEEIGKIARSEDILYLVDACQSVGQMPIDVHKIGCDILTATGRKYLRGPRGTGFLFLKSELIEDFEPPFIDVQAAKWISKDEYKIRSDARRFETWESYVAGKVGLAEAVIYAQQWGLENIWRRVLKLSTIFRQELEKVDLVTVRDIGEKKCGIVTFTVEGKDSVTIRKFLKKNKINVSVSTKEATLLDMESRTLDSVVRASIHYFNTEEEIIKFCRTLESMG